MVSFQVSLGATQSRTKKSAPMSIHAPLTPIHSIAYGIFSKFDYPEHEFFCVLTLSVRRVSELKYPSGGPRANLKGSHRFVWRWISNKSLESDIPHCRICAICCPSSSCVASDVVQTPLVS